MISSQYARSLAAYNEWQNVSIFAAADRLTEAERREDHRAFFRSIHGTLAHILWADHIWLSRFERCVKPSVQQKESGDYIGDWASMRTERMRTDAIFAEWTSELDEGALGCDLRWFSGSVGEEVSAPVWVIAAHIFNHQTHHRGQVHAMLTAAGERMADTDLFLMPVERWPVG